MSNNTTRYAWTREEDEILIRVRRKGLTVLEATYELAHNGYDRSVEAVKKRSQVLLPELVKTKGPRPTAIHRGWCQEEDDILRETHAAGQNDAEIQATLELAGYHRTVRAVEERRTGYLGIKRPRKTDTPKKANTVPVKVARVPVVEDEEEQRVVTSDPSHYRLVLKCISAVFCA